MLGVIPGLIAPHVAHAVVMVVGPVAIVIGAYCRNVPFHVAGAPVKLPLIPGLPVWFRSIRSAPTVVQLFELFVEFDSEGV